MQNQNFETNNNCKDGHYKNFVYLQTKGVRISSSLPVLSPAASCVPVVPAFSYLFTLCFQKSLYSKMSHSGILFIMSNFNGSVFSPNVLYDKTSSYSLFFSCRYLRPFSVLLLQSTFMIHIIDSSVQLTKTLCSSQKVLFLSPIFLMGNRIPGSSRNLLKDVKSEQGNLGYESFCQVLIFKQQMNVHWVSPPSPKDTREDYAKQRGSHTPQ